MKRHESIGTADGRSLAGLAGEFDIVPGKGKVLAVKRDVRVVIAYTIALHMLVPFLGHV
jgi:hypothetical protein